VTPQLRSELLKLRSTRTTVELVAWMVALVAFVVLLHALTLDAGLVAPRSGQLEVVGWGTGVAVLFASLVGALSYTAELRYGTIRPTLLASPSRTRVVAAKGLATALAGAACGLVAEALAIGFGAAGLAARGIDVQLTAGDIAQMLAGGTVAGALFAVTGVGIGAIVRSQVATVVGLAIWFLLVETVLVGNVPAEGKLTPGASAGALAGAMQTQVADKLLPAAAGGVLLAAYAAAALASACIVTERRDVE
jgi:ABC-type transport system involved in multi-copper enzyme maturation permease subunit